tara:strand:- start:265 stop:1206 length:942 start_codon:yes stop_codon:yes gene_type:complete
MTSNKNNKIKLIVITGPTATGKTALSVKLANNINGEIISADSRQIYRGMDLGTGKDLNEYYIGNNQIKHHLIDIIEPDKDYSVYNFQKDFFQSYQKIQNNNNIPIVCGGTGLYIESILLDYDLSKKPAPNIEMRKELSAYSKEKLMNIISSISSKKEMDKMLLLTKKQIIRNIEIIKMGNTYEGKRFPPLNNNALVVALRMDRELLRNKIKLRLIERINDGMINEVESLLNDGMKMERLDYFGLEYKFIGKYLRHEITKDKLIQDLSTAIRRFAKRQRTWFRRMEKRGVKINWIEYNDYEALENIVISHINES